jgi:hypothetical protein
MAVIEIIHTTTNQKSERSADRIFGRAWVVPPSFRVANEAGKNTLLSLGATDDKKHKTTNLKNAGTTAEG